MLNTIIIVSVPNSIIKLCIIIAKLLFMKVEKVFNHEEKDYGKFCEMNENFRKESTNALAFAGMMIPTIVSLSYLNYAISACVGGIFTLKGLMDLGTLSAYLVYVRQSAMPLNQFTQQVNFLLSALTGAEPYRYDERRT